MESNPDGSGKQKLTSSDHIGWLRSWSPDNNFILATTLVFNELTASLQGMNYVVVDTQSGSEIIIREIPMYSNGSAGSDLVWVGNREIAYIDEGVLYKITVDGQQLEKNKVPPDILAISYYLNNLNKTANKIAYDTEMPYSPYPSNVFIYDFTTKQKVQISEGGGAIALGWIGDNVVYRQNKNLWISPPDGKTKKKLVDLGEWNILESVIRDGSKIFYIAEREIEKQPQRKAFVYDSNLNKLIETSISILDNNISGLSISRDASFFSYTLRGVDYGTYFTMEFATNKVAKLCEYCYTPVWQN